ncbi:MAG: carboxypeptidase-like regulatory domain-containing protein, partial [Prevotellaceae bacterium]|nr:carboxypeptidase-like regulatory domain-containing protein [Prevotellaceae bacterium]
MQNTEYEIQNTEYRIRNTEYGIRNTEYRIQNTEYRIRNTEYRIQNTKYGILKKINDMKKILAILILTFVCANLVKAQNNNEWIEIDTLFADGLYKSAIEKINIKYAESLKNGDDVQFMKSIIYRLACQKYLEENVTEATVNALRSDLKKTQSDVAQALINSLLGEAFWNYYKQNRWKFLNRTDVNDDAENVDIATWSLNRIFDESIAAYKRSLETSEILQTIKTDYINNILIGNNDTRKYRPTLYDFIAHRAIATLGNSEIRSTKPKDTFVPDDAKLFTCNAQEFAQTPIVSSDSVSSLLFVLTTLQQLTKFHLQQNNTLALGDLTLKRLDFLNISSSLANKESLIMTNLQLFIDSSEKNEIWFEAAYKLAQMYKDNNEEIKAVELCNTALQQENISEKQKTIFEQYIKFIKCPSLGLTVENVTIPQKPIKILVKYKDLDTVYFRIYRVPNEYRFMMLRNIEKLPTDKEKFIERFALLVREWEETLPQQNDYKTHTTEIAHQTPLVQGIFIIVASDSPNFFNADEKIIEYATFHISPIAYVNRSITKNNNEIYIANRTTGKPLQNAKIQILDEKAKLKTEFISDSNGIIRGDIKTERKDIIVALHNRDFLIKNDYNIYSNNSRFSFGKSERTVFFLDRAIYRPGQTVYFKGIRLNNADNKYTISPDKKETIILRDVNQQEISKINVVSNEFGTFSGSFVLPQSTLGGTFTIKSDYGNAYFFVEEYKRPTFEVAFNPIEKNPKFNDSVNVSGVAKSYSGYNIDNAKVSYRIMREITFPYRWWTSMLVGTKIIADGETKTDNNGIFNINFFADESGLENDMQIVAYKISVDVTDNNGETHKAEYSVRISKKPLVINTNIPQNANTDDNLVFDLATKNLNNNFTESNITVKIYSLKQPEKPLRKRIWAKPDKHILSYEEYKKLFPDDVYEDEDKIEKFEEIALVKTISFNTNKTKKINLDELKKYGTSAYRFDITAKNPENIETNTKVYMQLQSNKTLTDMKNWIYKGKQTEKYVEFFVGGMSDSTHVHYDIIYRNNIIETKNIIVGTTPESIKINIPKTKNNEEFEVTFVSIYENRLYTASHTIKPREDKTELDISLVTFRDKLQPDEKEQWKLRIKSPNGEKAMAEMVASLYDASLDAFAKNDWNKDFAKSQTLGYYNINWSQSTAFGSTDSKPFYGIYKNNFFSLAKSYNQLMSIDYIKNYAEFVKNISNQKVVKGKIKGIVVDENYMPVSVVSVMMKGNTKIGTYTNINGEFEVTAQIGDILVFSSIGYISQEIVVTNNIIEVILLEDKTTLDEIIVVGNETKREKSYFGSTTMIRGTETSYKDDDYTEEDIPFAQPFYIKPTDKTAEITKIRTNFNETAFFYPELRTDENGEIIIDFVIPETLTRWKMLGLAHTKNLETGKITAYTITQKEVAITANAPRFFRQGDEIEFSAKVNNVSEKNINGKAQLLLFDAFTMQPVNIIEGSAEQAFAVKTNQSAAVKWNLKIPSNVDAITYRVLAIADKHSDGEEKTIPVLPNSMLVTESLPFTVRANQNKDFSFDKLINNTSTTLKNYSYTLEFTSNPMWYAVQAIPYMMEYPYECSEQVFSRFYANSISAAIVDKFPQIKRTFDLWKMKDSKELLSNLEKNQELKNVLLEETPWLLTAKTESENKKRIALLFDLNKMKNEQKSALEKLKQKQLSNGAFAWFSGMCESRYITQHIAIGLQHLKKLQAVNGIYKNDVDKISNAAIKYLDAKMLEDYNYLLKNKVDLLKYEITPLLLHYLYLRSFAGIGDLSKEQKTAFDYLLSRIDKNWANQGIYQQALIAIIAHRFEKTNIAQKIINSLNERAQTSEEMGMYWAENRCGYFWYQSPIETQSLLIEAFSEIGNKKTEVEEMKIWLLRNKQTNNWETTKATAEACYALLSQGENNLNDNALLQVKINSTPLEELKNEDLQNAEIGTGYVKTAWHGSEIQNNFGKINVANPNKTIAWGAAYWQYFENLDKITSAETGLKIKREYFITENTDKGAKLNRITEKSKIKVGDKIKVRIELRADRDYEYVHLKDMRASGFEPVNVLSQSKYQDGIWYYETTKDASTNFFIYELKKGTYVFEYDLRANNAGEFSAGIATFQCMYA